jgi:hypothetical protein
MANPFRTQGTVRPPYFTNRAEEIKRIRRALATPTAKVLVWGERRTGKTSCLEMALEAHRQQGGHGLLADFSTASSVVDLSNRLLVAAGAALSRSWTDFASELLQRIGLTLKVKADPVSGLITPSLELGLRSAPLAEQRRSLERVLGTLDEMAAARSVTLGIVIDEFQEIHRFGGESAEWHLRGILQQQQNTSYVLAGSRPHLIRRMLGKNRAFYQMLDRIPFGPIDPDHFARWIEERMESAGVSARGIGARCIEIAGPRTRDVVELARKAYDLGVGGGRVDEDLLRRSFFELVDGEDDLARPYWDSLTPHQQNIFRAVAAGSRQLTAQETRTRFALRSSAAISKAVREFVESGHLVKLAGKQGYDFDSPYLRGWVIRNALPDLGWTGIDPLAPRVP